jgi:hypothetical protein
MDVSPAGAATRETPFLQSYRAQCAHVTAVWRGEVAYKPPTDQLLLYRVVEAIYKSAEDGKEVRWPSA